MPVPINWHGKPRRAEAERTNLVLDDPREGGDAQAGAGAGGCMHQVERLQQAGRSPRTERQPVERIGLDDAVGIDDHDDVGRSAARWRTPKSSA